MSTCLEYAEERTESCAEYADQGYNTCTQYRDDGYNACTQWRDDGYSACDSWAQNCCTWWPCNWFCALITLFCVAWVWISSLVCVVWVWVSSLVCVVWVWVSSVVCILWTLATTLVCVLWDIVITVLSAVLTVLEAVLGWVLSFVAAVMELIFAIPFIGRLLQWFWNSIVLNIVYIIPNALDAAMYNLGIRPQKKLRVCTIILRDADGVPLGAQPGVPDALVDDVVELLNNAIDIMLRECNVQILNSAPLQFSSGLSSSPNRADRSWVQIDGRPGKTAMLRVRCDAAGFGDDAGTSGSEFQLNGLTNCFFGNWRRLTGLGSPVVIFVVQSIDGSANAGCGLWAPNYLTITVGGAVAAKPSPLLAHELGHMCNLWHICDAPNLMCARDATCTTCLDGSVLDSWQETLVRASRHVSYF